MEKTLFLVLGTVTAVFVRFLFNSFQYTLYFVITPFFAAGSFHVTIAESIEETTTLMSAGGPGTDRCVRNRKSELETNKRKFKSCEPNERKVSKRMRESLKSVKND